MLGRLARRQAGVFTRADAIAAGVPSGEIRRRVRRGAWTPWFGGALRAATTPDSVDGRERAALVRAGEGAVLSHFSAARRWRFGVSEPAEVWVTVPHRRTPRPTPGLRVTRSRHLPSSAVRAVDGVPVLEPARTIVDLARHLDERRLTAVALDALQRELCTHEEIVAWHRVLTGRRGVSVLARVLEVADPAFESILAAEFGQLARLAHVPVVPRYRLRLPTGEEVVCDFADLRARIDFEVDGFAYHSAPAQVARDRARDRRLFRTGWLVVRYGTDDIRRRPTETIADVLNQIAARLRTS
jgi:hypothetical protein